MYVSGSRGHLTELTAKTKPKALNNGVEKRWSIVQRVSCSKTYCRVDSLDPTINSLHPANSSMQA